MERNVQSSTPVIDAVYNAIGGDSGSFKGVTYNVSRDNRLDAVIHTPNFWGKETVYSQFNELTPSEAMLQAIHGCFARASKVVDITTLTPLADGGFFEAIKAGVKEADEYGRPITIRILAGTHPDDKSAFVYGSSTVDSWLTELTKDLKSTSKLTIYCSVMISSILGSWNHSKIVAVDGRQAIVGGHNMWDADYNQFAPVHDLSIEMSGSAAGDCHRFANKLWQFVGDYYQSYQPHIRIWSKCWKGGNITSKAAPQIDISSLNGSDEPVGCGSVPVLAIGRLGNGIVSSPDAQSNASDTAKVEAIKAAKTCIKLSQQDLGFSVRGMAESTSSSWVAPTLSQWMGSMFGWSTETPAHKLNMLFNHELMLALVQAIDRGVKVQIVLSGQAASSGGGNPYSNMGPQSTLEWLKFYWTKYVKPDSEHSNVKAAFKNVEMAAVHTCGSETPWLAIKDNQLRKHNLGNHAKMYLIDDRAFYVGSDNFYPCALQEFGFLVEDETAAQTFISSYWQPLWHNALKIVDPDTLTYDEHLQAFKRKESDMLDDKLEMGLLRHHWMKNMRASIGEKKLIELVLPGTHDTGTYPFAESSPCQGILGQAPANVQVTWGRTQHHGFKNQLMGGIRYFDIRLTKRTSDNGLYLFHGGMLGEKVDVLIKEVTEFTKLCPEELLILDFQDLAGFDSSDHRGLFAAMNEAFGDYMVPAKTNSQLGSLTLNQVLDTGQRIIVFYNDADKTGSSKVWARDQIYLCWHNKDNPVNLRPAIAAELDRYVTESRSVSSDGNAKKYTNEQLDYSRRQIFFGLQCQCTFEVKKFYQSGMASLHECALLANAQIPIYFQDFKRKWPYKRFGGIVMIDFFSLDDHQLTDYIIGLNTSQ